MTLGQNVSFSAGMDTLGQGGAVANGTVNLSNGTAGFFAISAGQTLGLSANNGYTLNVLSPVNNATAGTLSGGGTSGAKVYLTLNNSAGASVVPAGCDFILSNPQTNGQFSPQGTGGVTFAGGFSGNLSQLTPAAGGTFYLPTANLAVTGSTLDVANGGLRPRQPVVPGR